MKCAAHSLIPRSLAPGALMFAGPAVGWRLIGAWTRVTVSVG